MAKSGYERRIGSRNPAPSGLAVSWRLCVGKFPLKRMLTFEATLVDISLSGARVVAPAHRPLRVGQRLVVAIAGHNAEVEVRRAEPADASGGTIAYGLMFQVFSPELEEVIRAWVRPDDDDELLEIWLRLS